MKVLYIIGLTAWLFIMPLWAQDNLNIPTILSVSVDTATGDVDLKWIHSTSPDIEKYVIYYDNTGAGGGFLNNEDVQASVGTNIQTYRHENESVNKESVAYSIEAVDSSGETSILAPSHKTIFLSAYYDSCEQRFNLTWTAYNAWGDSLLAYNVYLNQDNSGYKRIGLVFPDNSNDTSGYQNNILENENYCYFIEAVHIDGARRSTSNIVCHFTEMPRHPSWINADYSTVSSNRLIKLSFSFDPLSEINTFELMRGKEDSAQINFPLYTFSNYADNPIIYYDTVAYDTIKYFYLLNAMDACDETVETSNMTGNIALKAKREELMVNLTWSPYQEWRYGVDQYLIYRVLNETDTTRYDSVPIGTTTYDDNVTDLLNKGISGQISYFVSASENAGNPYFNQAKSRSNTVSIDITPEVYMPNAFSPNDDRLNDSISPKITFEPKEYHFLIYDRWGAEVFETNNSNEAWDGKLPNGSYASASPYLSRK